MRAVLDVGQYVSATIQARGHPAQILTAWRAGEFDLVTSGPILDDLRRVLFYPHIRKRHQWSDEDKILACAKEGQVDYIVASDEHLAKLGSFAGIPIIPPRRFLEILAEQREKKEGQEEGHK